ncbi:MAG: peptide-methionine (S)-S-oxide reductase [Puniceicoccaceae bacterium]|nr:MAG: peptide-methionine (S)-S-oxide reductase [Puniceicoccaceae bacterium]
MFKPFNHRPAHSVAISLISLLFASVSVSCAQENSQPVSAPMTQEEKSSLSVATFGAGCFWCVEAVFQNIEGVRNVESGYMGGHVDNPTYREVSMGTTGHAEVAQIHYNPEIITYETILDWLWRSHDPTTLNRQGADVGTQYRSVIFYHDQTQRTAAETSKAEAQKNFKDPIVTEITKATHYYVAEDYHQNYYRENASAPYCQMVIRPKLQKLGLE